MEKNQSIFNILFYIGYFCLIINSMFYRIIGFEKISFLFSITSYIVLSFVILLSFNKVSKKYILFVLFSIIACLISSRLTGNYLPLRFIFVILASKNVEFKKIVKNDMLVRIALMIIVVLCHYAGITNDYILYRSDETIRNSMGFSHPNIFSFHLLMITLEFFYLKYTNNRRNKLSDYLLLIVVLIIMNVCSDSRSSMLALFVFGILFFFRDAIYKYSSKHKSILFIFGFLFIGFTIVSILCTIFYSPSNSFLYSLDKITSYRLYYSNYFYNTYGFSLLGQKVVTISTEYAMLNGVNALVLDNVYIQLLVRYGVLVYSIFAIMFIKSSYYAFKERNMYMFIIIIVLVLFGLMESQILIIETCPFLIYFNNVVYLKKAVNEDE